MMVPRSGFAPDRSSQHNEESRHLMSPQTTPIAEHPRLGISPAALRVARLSKTFPGTRGLIDASIEIRTGEVHALVGQNGSGKSTLIKTLAGYHMPDPGATAEMSGQPFTLGDTVPEGLRFVHQVRVL